LGWEVGYFFWGWWIDRSVQGSGATAKTFDRSFGILSLLVLPVAAAAFTHTVAVVLALLFLGMFASAGFVIVSLAETTRRHSTEHGAYLAGLGSGAWSGVVAMAMPMFGRLLDRANYPAAYALAAAAPPVGWLVWRAVIRPSQTMA
jgi:hypothetical protein